MRLLVPLLLVLAGCSAGQHQARVFSLSAQLTSDDITLTWSGAPTDAAYLQVEYATEETGPYTTLDFLPPDQTSYTHPDLMPATKFYYRVAPLTGTAVPVRSVKALGRDVLRFNWQDTSTDEDGYLLEIQPRSASTYRVLGFLDPDTTTIDLNVLPAERNATFQVRPFHRGTASPVAHEASAPENS